MNTKIKVTQQQRDNALEALNVMWPSVPPENVYPELEGWRKLSLGRAYDVAPDCGTVACFGGWCAWWPIFRAQGIYTSSTGAPVMPWSFNPNSASQYLFGHISMFSGRGFHEADATAGGLTDHELVSHRLRWLIENSEVVG